jgi:probable selenium-dependent hydroxylase accessory protein YqeC
MTNPVDGQDPSIQEAQKDFRELVSALSLGARENIAIVGAGGKTSLVFALAEALSSEGKRVVTSTTTKIWQSEAGRSPAIFLFPSGEISQKKIKKGLEQYGHIFVGKRNIDTGKVMGISRGQADELFENSSVDYLIIEADGSKGRPLKAHADHEPVIPHSATVVIAVAGLEALGKRLEPGVVFREELFMALTGLKSGQIISKEIVAKVFSRPDGMFKSTPSQSRRMVFLNKRDTLANEGAFRSLAELILGKKDDAPELVVAGSIRKGEFSVYRKDK